MKLKKGDKVNVITGKDKGKSGKILQVLRKKDRVVVEGINIVKKHQKPTTANQTGGIIEKEAPIHISNVAIVDAKSDKTKKVSKETDKKSKISKKSNEKID